MATKWQDSLNKGTFRGVPFFVADTRYDGGRRLSVFEFPLRDTPYIEDLGKKVVRFVVNAYVVIGPKTPNYIPNRNDLKEALDATGDAGTLQHPYYGQKRVRVESYSIRESRDEGGIAYFSITFIRDDGAQASPTARIDTAATVIGVVASLKAKLASASALLYKVAGYAGYVQTYSTAILQATHGNFSPLLRLGGLSQSGVQGALSSFQQIIIAGAQVESVFNAIQNIFSTYSTAVTAPTSFVSPHALPTTTVLLPVSPFVPLVEYSRALPIGETTTLDPTFGLGSFATYGSDFKPVAATTADTTQMAANQTAIVQAVNIGAISAISEIYAQTTFANTKIAKSALDNLLGWLTTQSDLAAFLGQDQLYLVLQQLIAAVVQDMNERAVKIPSITTYATGASMPSLALSQRLYRDSTHDQQLVALNDAPHPMFMPMTGEALSS